ncbi:MAG TPA: hypothetical protein VI318_23925 [Baekduia sp.]
MSVELDHIISRLGILIAVGAIGLGTASRCFAQPRPTPRDVGPLGTAGGFVVQSCGESGSSDGWAATNSSSAQLQTGVVCPPNYGALPPNTFQTGIWITDRLGNAGGSDAAPGARAEITFVPLPGTAITRVRWWRSVEKRLDDNWLSYTAIDSSNNVIDSCDIDPLVTNACNVGSSDWYANDDDFAAERRAYTDLDDLWASAVIVGVSCRPNPDNVCGNNYSVNNVGANVYSAFFTIAERVAPAVTDAVGLGWTTTAWSDGTLPLSVTSSDATGIAATRVYADGSVIATLQRSCSYTRPRPCTDEPDGAVGLPTAALADGPHYIEVGVEDAAGNETKIARPEPLLVDNAAPATPVGLAVRQAAADENRFSARWSLPADAGSAIDQAEYRVCMDDGCSAPRVAGSLTGVDGIVLPHVGRATLRVWLRDAQGHADEGRAATVELAYAPPPIVDPPPVCSCDPTLPSFTPPLTTTPPIATTPPNGGAPPKTTRPRKSSPGLKLTTLRRVGTRVTVGGTVSSKASGTVTVRYRVKSRGRTRTLTKRVKIRRKAFKTVLALSPTFAAARVATVSVAYAGDADTAGQTRTATVRTRA